MIERSVIVCESANFSVDESWLSRRPSATEQRGELSVLKKLPSQEKALIEAALRESGGQVYGPSGAAVKLGIPRSTLEHEIRSLKINKGLYSFGQLSNVDNLCIRQFPVLSIGCDWLAACLCITRMLRIQRSANGTVVFALSGQIDDEDVAGLESLIKSEANGLGVVLDLRNLTLVGRDAIGFLERCEADGVTLTNCAGYVREWITRLRSQPSKL